MKRINVVRAISNGNEKSLSNEEERLDAFQTGGISPPKNKKGNIIPFKASSESKSQIESRINNNPTNTLPLALSQIRLSEFLSVYFPDENEPIHIRAISAKGTEGKAEKLITTRLELARDSALQEHLKSLNKSHGIYFVVNAGGDTDKEIKRFNAFFAEIDDRPIKEQTALFKQALLPPSILLITKKSVHAYWLLYGNCSEEEWRDIERRLISHFKSDVKIQNPSRVMRLPHFNHVSYSRSEGLQYKKVELVEFNPNRRYTTEEMRNAFPPSEREAHIGSETNYKVDLSTKHGLDSELRSRILRHPTSKVRGVYANAKGICHSGEGNSALFIYLPTGAVKCLNGCPYSKILEAFGLPSSPLSSGESIFSPQPSEQAFYGLAGKIVNLIDPHTESDPMAILLQTFVLFGNVIGRTAHFRVEADRHFLNLFTVIVGNSAKGRKGTSLGQVKNLFSLIDPKWLKNRLLPGLSSGEGLIWAVRDPIEKLDAVKEKGRVVEYQKVKTDEGITDKRLLVVEPEFASTLKVLGREGNTLSAVIRQSWDTGDLNTLTKNSPAQATNAHISINAHITIDELKRNLSTTEMANGFANRFLWVYAKRSKLLPEGGRLRQVDLAPITNSLREAVEFARSVDEMNRDEEANKLWYQAYAELTEGQAGLFGAVIARAEAQVMRLACIYALLDFSDTIRKPHLEAALALWQYCEDSARYIFGDAFGNSISDEIAQRLRESENGLTKTQIRDSFGRNRSASQINFALRTLAQAGRVQRILEKPDGRGRPTERWRYLEKPSSQSQGEAQNSRIMSYVVNERKNDSSIGNSTIPAANNTATESVEETPGDNYDEYDRNDRNSNKRSERKKLSGSDKTKERDSNPSKKKRKLAIPARTKKLNLKQLPKKQITANKEGKYWPGMLSQ